MSWTQEWQIKTLFYNNFSKLGITNLLNFSFYPQLTMPFARVRKRQTFRETTFAKRGNVKPFGKRLSPSAEMPNHSGNDFRQARKCQTLRETTFAERGNAKLFGKRLSPTAEMPNLLKSGLREARKPQNVSGKEKGSLYETACLFL